MSKYYVWLILNLPQNNASDSLLYTKTYTPLKKDKFFLLTYL